MDMYRVDWLKSAKTDLAGIYRYMSKQSTRLMARMFVNVIQITAEDKLSFMPQKYRLLGDVYLAASGLRKVNVKNYSIFFVINEDEKIVNVVRVIHSKRDWINVLQGKR